MKPISTFGLVTFVPGPFGQGACITTPIALNAATQIPRTMREIPSNPISGSTRKQTLNTITNTARIINGPNIRHLLTYIRLRQLGTFN